jgi:hypothetical protein
VTKRKKHGFVETEEILKQRDDCDEQRSSTVMLLSKSYARENLIEKAFVPLGL